ncbi:TrmB family transcriptional regulator sugar-binding domain-containing protein, partial [Halomarina halobia]
TDVLVAEGVPEGDVPMRDLVGQAAIVVESEGRDGGGIDQGTYTIGGWGAILEDVEAERVTVTSIDLN